MQRALHALFCGMHTATLHKEIAIPELQMRKQVQGSKATVHGLQVAETGLNVAGVPSARREGAWKRSVCVLSGNQ